jgi:hypothetical protein
MKVNVKCIKLVRVIKLLSLNRDLKTEEVKVRSVKVESNSCVAIWRMSFR